MSPMNTLRRGRSRGGGPMEEGMPILEAEDLSVGYGAMPVLRDVSLKVHPGEVLAILGPNGAGKSSLLMGLAGGLSPMSGQVKWRGSVTTDALHRRCRNGLAYVTEERTIIPSLSTADNLRLGRYGKDAALEIMPELEPLLRRRAGLLSGGEQQMLALARALGQRPNVLLADELSLGLAPLIVRRLLQAIRDAADTSGVGAVIVEQKVRDVLAIADRAIVLSRGRVVMQGTREEIQSRLGEIEESYFSRSSLDEVQP